MYNNAIEIKNIKKTFGDFVALQDLSLSIPNNSIFGLLGSNGAGKTTTINMLTGLLNPDKGEIFILDLNSVDEIAEIRNKVALVPQTISLYENLTVYENLEFFGSLYINDKNKLEYEIDQLLFALKLDEKINVKICDLSGGYKRRCSIGCALIADPKILILDEPLTGIDLYTTKFIINFIKNLKNTTIIFTTHSIKEAESICDRIVFLDKGNKILEGKPDNIKKEYAHILGEKIVIEFNDGVDLKKVQKKINENFNVKDFELRDYFISFRIIDLGKSVIEIMEKLDSFKSEIINIDLKKPSLEEVFDYVLKK